MPVPLGILAASAGANYFAAYTGTAYGDLRAVEDSEGSIYFALVETVSSFTEYNTYITKLNSAGAIVWQKKINDANQYDDLLIDSSNNIYIHDSNNNRIAKINSAGSLVWAKIISGMTPDQLVFDSSSNVFVRDSGNERICKINSTATSVLWAKQVTESTTTFRQMAIDADGNPWISSTQNADLRLLEFATSDGSILTTIARDSSASWSRMAIASNGDIYIGDIASQNTTTIRRFNSAGTELTGVNIVAPGSNNHQIQALAVDSSDNVYALFTNQTNDIAYIWQFNSSLSPVWTNGLDYLDNTNPNLDELFVRGSNVYISGGGDQLWKLPTSGRGYGTYSVSNSGVLTNYLYDSFSLTTSTPTALASDTGSPTITNPTVSLSDYTVTLVDTSLPVTIVPIG